MMNFQNNPQFGQMNPNFNQFFNPQQNWNMCMPMFYPNNMNPNMNQRMMMNNMQNMNNMRNNFCMYQPIMQNNMNMLNNSMNNFCFNNVQNNNQNMLWNANMANSANNINCPMNNNNFGMNNIIQGMNNLNLNNNGIICGDNTYLSGRRTNIWNQRTATLLLRDYEEIMDENDLINKLNILDDCKENKNNNKESNSKDNLLANKDIQKLKRDIKKINNKLELIFTKENLSKLIDEKELLNFFYFKEKECIQFVNDNFDKEYILKDFMIGEIQKVFYRNPLIHGVAKKVIQKLRAISNENIQTLQEFSAKISINFPGIEMPNFLIQAYMQNLDCVIFLEQKNRETETMLKQIQSRNVINDSKKLILFLDSIRQNNSLIFEGINFKFELLELFIDINSKVFKKRYRDGEFFQIFQTNEDIIKKYISPDFSYSIVYKDFKSKSKEQRNEGMETLFNLFEQETCNKKDIVLSIIASFYYLLFYLFKSSKFSKDYSNLGNPFINLILKNFVIFLDKKINKEKKVAENFYELLKDLYISDVNYLINMNKIYEMKNKGYQFFELDYLLLNNDRVKEYYLTLKKKFTWSGHFGKYGIGVGRNITTFEQKIELYLLDENVFTNKITIIIDGFGNENENPMNKWKDFIKYFKKETMFYYYRWPSGGSVSKFILNGVLNFLLFDRGYCPREFRAASLRAKIAGKILAYIIYSNTIFKNFQINLVAFSLGNHVIKHCIKELYKLNYNMKNIDKTTFLSRNENNNPICINSVIFCAAATYFSKIESWIKYIREIIVDKFINCYSGSDWEMKVFYKSFIEKTAIGVDRLNIFYQGENLVDNYYFDYWHIFYKMGTVAKKIAGDYKEI